MMAWCWVRMILTRYVVTVKLMSELDTSKSFAMAVMAGKYMLADRGESRPMKDIVKTMSFFFVSLNIENGGSVSGSNDTAPNCFSTSIFRLLLSSF